MIHLVVALPAEARPLAARLRLKAGQGPSPFPIWEGEGATLAVSGIGKTLAAAAAGYLFARSGEGRGAAWLNVGIAGHRQRPVGEALVAHKVTDAGSGRNWYPQMPFDPPCGTVGVRTVDRVETEYPTDDLYEMEASGFCAATARMATAELVQVLKVVSDNRRQAPDRLSAAAVEGLVEAAWGTVEALIDRLAELASELARRRAAPTALGEALAGRRFTVSERRHLERLLRRLEVFEPAEETAAAVAGLASAAEVLARLADRLAVQPPGGR